MLKKQAFDFWKTYIEFLTKGIIDVPMPNPAIEFLADVKAGKYDEISDKEYDELLNSTAELASFWKKKRKATVGEIVREALIHMNLSLSETEKLAQILAEASTCKTYLLRYISALFCFQHPSYSYSNGSSSPSGRCINPSGSVSSFFSDPDSFFSPCFV